MNVKTLSTSRYNSTNAVPNYPIEYLIVAGGGGGGNSTDPADA